MSDKRSVATDALETLGTIIDDTAKRDAIHLAVTPAVAGQRLEAGWHVTVTDGIAMSADEPDALGIVDPFLRNPVRKGQRFWLVIYPRKITSLRHVWSHPALPDEIGLDAIATSKVESERWLRDFCAQRGITYELVIGGIASLSDGDWSVSLGREEGGGDIPPELWAHAEVVLGRKIDKRPTYFSCSC